MWHYRKYWKSLNEDQKLYWNIGSRAVAFILGFFMTKTGIKFFDYCASYITIFLPLLIIQSQRSYNGFSRRMRRLVIGTAVNMTAWGVVAVGVPVFAYAAFAAAVSTLQTTPMPFADTPHAEIKLTVIFAVMAFLMFYTAIKDSSALQPYRKVRADRGIPMHDSGQRFRRIPQKPRKLRDSNVQSGQYVFPQGFAGVAWIKCTHAPFLPKQTHPSNKPRNHNPTPKESIWKIPRLDLMRPSTPKPCGSWRAAAVTQPPPSHLKNRPTDSCP